ncbi:hypothetical protein PILCRDRAFT_88310 [Piloderma croceum F 1598]|uniref:Uncharacterized protein n=1 Tax=Piloderma croceum (strain F 1598) TaxID=765440 RepID=A0A0C3C0D6_PILCF|nr:hypothetical protein PILCRDRAFT_88310 [Piloderma croceum F 1598]
MVLWTDANVTINIFFLELVTILSAVHYAASLPHPPRKLVIFTDSLDSVGVFNSLSHPLICAPMGAIAGALEEVLLEVLVSGLKYLMDIYPDFNASHSHPLVQAAINGSKKACADPVCQKLPLWPAHLKAFLQKARLMRKYDDLLFAVILACCFYGCHCTGELVIKSDKHLFDWKKIIKFYSSTDVLFIEQDVTSPVLLLHDIHDVHAVLLVCEDGSIPDQSWFDTNFFGMLDCTYRGHSARAGGAAFYVSLGLSEDVIQALRCWSSQAWKIYIRDNPSIRAEYQLALLCQQQI